MSFFNYFFSSHSLLDELNDIIDSDEDKLKQQYHLFTKCINDLSNNLKYINDIDMIDAFYDGISMHEKLRLSIFKKLRKK